jgi:hypothetical protein
MNIHSNWEPLQSVVAVAIASATVALFAQINVLAATAIDPTSALRGSLGASLGDLSLSNNFGKLSFLLNGGFALLFGAFASLAVARRRSRITPTRSPLIAPKLHGLYRRALPWRRHASRPLGR